jgi:hypothetical protein
MWTEPFWNEVLQGERRKRVNLLGFMACLGWGRVRSSHVNDLPWGKGISVSVTCFEGKKKG